METADRITREENKKFVTDQATMFVPYKTGRCYYCDSACEDRWCSRACMFVEKNHASDILLYAGWHMPPFALLAPETQRWYIERGRHAQRRVYLDQAAGLVYADDECGPLNWSRSSEQCLLCGARVWTPEPVPVPPVVGDCCSRACASVFAWGMRRFFVPDYLPPVRLPHFNRLEPAALARAMLTAAVFEDYASMHVQELDERGITVVLSIG